MSRKTRLRRSALAYKNLIPNIFFLPDAAEWLSTCRSLMVRQVRLGQPLDRVALDLGLDGKMAAGLVSIAKPLIEAPSGDWHDPYIDSLLCDERECPRANAIGRAMYEVLRQGLLARYFVRDVVLQYAARVKQLGVERALDVCDDFEFARVLVRFVDALGVENLAIRFSMSGRSEIGSADLRKIQEKLDIPQTLLWVFRKLPATRRSPAGALIGVEVVRCFPDKQVVADRAFQSAVLLAEVVEPWRFSSAAPGHSAQLADSVGGITGHRNMDREAEPSALLADQEPMNPFAEDVAT